MVVYPGGWDGNGFREGQPFPSLPLHGGEEEGDGVTPILNHPWRHF
jgi:hypothetical protein